MKFTKKHRTKWERFKSDVKKKKKKLHLYTKWNFGLDKNTKNGNIRIGFTYPIQVEVDGEIKQRQKQKKIYKKNRTFQDLDLLLREVEEVDKQVNDFIDSKINELSSWEEDELGLWIENYVKRGETEIKDLAPSTIESDEKSLNDFHSWLKSNKPKKLTIYHLDKELLLEYFAYRSKIGGVFDERYNKRTKWSNSTVRTSYRRIRAFYNWMAKKTHLGLDIGKLNNMDMPKVQVETESFSPAEIKKIYNFMEEEKGSREWGWFIPMLNVLLLTGCRISECANMKIEDIDLDSREWYFSGKGSKLRKTAFRDEGLWKDIKSRIVDDNGNVFDKEFVFHFEYWKQGTKGIGGYKHGSSGHKGKYELGHLVKNEQKNFSKSGVYQKFKKMVKHLNLNDDLTPHSCRRYFITEMLKRTNGNIPLVAQLVGHSNWDMVRRYSKSVITDETEVNINLKEIVSKNN